MMPCPPFPDIPDGPLTASFDVAFDRTSCSRLNTNHVCVLLTAAACVPLQELQFVAHGAA
jgi:hypothetical protein